VRTKRETLREFLEWGNSREQIGLLTRLANRDDLNRVREIERDFFETWWAIVVYTCLDSTVGTRAVAPYFPQPVDGAAARALLAGGEMIGT
jgi:hypothetical protein